MSLEQDIRLLNAADEQIRAGLRAYIGVGWPEEEVMERVAELFGEEMDTEQPQYVGGGPKRRKKT